MRQTILFSDRATGATVEPAPADVSIILCLNIRNPSPARAELIVDYIAKSRASIVVLTEAKESTGCDNIISWLESAGFAVSTAPVPEKEYRTIIAVRGLRSKEVPVPDFFMSHRVTCVKVATPVGKLLLLGVYAPSNGLTPESAARRARFQREFRRLVDRAVTYGDRGLVLVAGDLNVLEPGHQPHVPAFLGHDYDFYSCFGNAGMVDTFRLLYPGNVEHSWVSPFGEGQRLDHFFISAQASSRVMDCWYDHTTRTSKLSDHSAMYLSLGSAEA